MTASAHGMSVMRYQAPVVTIREGNSWVTSGSFNLVHTINLQQYEDLVRQSEVSVRKAVKNEDMRLLLSFHLNQTWERISELKNPKTRKTRSINWLGSAWKWLAGSPDAIDWNKILDSQEGIIENNEQQYKINQELFKSSRQVAEKINQLIDRVNNVSREGDVGVFHQMLLGKVLILKGQVADIVRACQMAKNGIVNTNLLDTGEVNNIINELETLPYENVIEAIEYGRPSVYSNGTLLLYVLSMPKVKSTVYHMVTVRGVVQNGLQIQLDYKKLLINQLETYGVIGSCLTIGNSSVCESNALVKIPEDSCLPRILKVGHAECHFVTRNSEIIELIGGNTIFVTNFNGSIEKNNSSVQLEGTFLIQLHNETVQIKGQNFSSTTTGQHQALPEVLTKITNKGVKPDVDYVHHLSLDNIRHINMIKDRQNLTFFIELAAVLAILGVLVGFASKIFKKANIPTVNTHTRMPSPSPQPRANITDLKSSSPVDLRDADI